MELMYIRTHGEDVEEGYLRRYEADFDITSDVENPTNDFEVMMAMPTSVDELLYKENEISTILYVDGTEFGGIISGYDIDVGAGTITYTGYTWRGLLSLYIIEPPTGQDYRIVTSGTNLATAISALPIHPIISIQDTALTASRQFQYNRYITVHEGVSNMLRNSNANYRLKFAYDEKSGKVLLSVGSATDRTNLIEISQDYDDKVKLSITHDGSTPRHLICLGEGELKDRRIQHLYADENWNIGTTAISGAYPVDTYDYSGSNDLLTDGKKHFRELIDQHTKIEVKVDGIDLNLSDIIAARELLTGEYVTAEITKIVWKCTDMGTYQTESFDYSTAIKTHRIESEGKA